VNKIAILVGLAACIFLPGYSQQAKDQIYQVTQAYQVNDQGQVVSQQVLSGQIVLSAGGSYRLSLHIQDEGTYQLVKAGPQQAQDTIVFTSQKGSQFYGYPQQNTLSLWLNRSPQGINQWATAVLAGSQKIPVRPGPSPSGPTQPQGSLIQGNVFSTVVLYGTISSPSYYWYDQATGSFSDDQKGIIFWPNGAYYLKAEFGSTLMEERGRYAISGNQVQLVFSDGSSMVLVIEQGGRKLHSYSSGMLLAEYFFLGTGK
jgi:hypothetical protein